MKHLRTYENFTGEDLSEMKDDRVLKKFFNNYNKSKKDFSYFISFRYYNSKLDNPGEEPINYYNSVSITEDTFFKLIDDKDSQLKMCQEEVKKDRFSKRTEEELEKQVNSINSVTLECNMKFKKKGVKPSTYSAGALFYYLPDSNKISIYIEPSFNKDPEMEKLAEMVKKLDAMYVYNYVKNI